MKKSKIVKSIIHTLLHPKEYYNRNHFVRSTLAYEPELLPPIKYMHRENVYTLEEWFRWAEEWSMLIRMYGGITANSAVLEIGCGLGRIAFPLRFILSSGTYDGFDICQYKIAFLQQHFQKQYPNFRFTWANIHNTYYNQKGTVMASKYRFPYDDQSFDIVFAASLFTHLLPEAAEHYFRETARVLKPGGRCLFSFFLLDYYRPSQPRLYGFSSSKFNFDYSYKNFKNNFAITTPENPEEMTAYRLDLICQFAQQAGLELAQDAVPGIWSGSISNWISTQDLIVLKASDLHK